VEQVEPVAQVVQAAQVEQPEQIPLRWLLVTWPSNSQVSLFKALIFASLIALALTAAAVEAGAVLMVVVQVERVALVAALVQTLAQ
jgi:hypothetical protein